MRELRRKVLIPAFTLTEVCHADDPHAVVRSIKDLGNIEAFTYHVKPVTDPDEETAYNYNLFPVVLDRDSVPWNLGTLFILGKLENETGPAMTTFHSLADDLGAYKEWLDSHEDPNDVLFNFPKMKLRRVTYRYRGYLKKRVEVGEVAGSTANRRMSTVISFYRWMIADKIFEPANEPWEERTFDLALKNSYGRLIKTKVVSTNLKIPAPKTEDILDDAIQDEGKLRPLPDNEQRWVMEAADALGNGEMYLILLFMILTGVRIQTVCTLRVRNFMHAEPKYSKALSGTGKVLKLKVGPGTGIDTKRDKDAVVQIPSTLYELLHTYAHSGRAQRRRAYAPGGDHPDQYLFLTQQGSPYYNSKEETRLFNPSLSRRHHKNGGTVRQFLKDHLIPYVQKHHDPKFMFRPHDLRATFGMNQTDIQMALVQRGAISLSKARTNVMTLMWHASSETTEKYLNYRKNMKMFNAVVNGYGDHLQEWIKWGMKGEEN